MRGRRLELVQNLDYGRLLAKVVITLLDVLTPIQQQHGAGRGARRSPDASNYDSLTSEATMHDAHTFPF